MTAHHQPTTPVSPSPCLTNFPAPANMGKAARDLTAEEARDIVIYLISQGHLSLASGPLFNSQCHITRPRIREHIRIRPNVIAGVEFINLAGRAGYIDNVDMRMAVVLYRLASEMRRDYGATTIYHMGIGHGRGPANDCHNQGRALDFAGADTNRGSFRVLRDWGRRPVRSSTTNTAIWAPNATTTSYRLIQQDNPYYDFFTYIYNFAVRECQDRSESPNSQNSPGSNIGYASIVCHPDHPDPRLRRDHQDHVHMQIGRTRS